ncbi:AI-2E family transporter [Nitratireductor sp. ZSWI3]|uniref:AI-2E family transporter n=1 Tax=Nitratireductor sp. ZSWI3 TaxID=2966359 RepID=UPI0021503C90|nr:AI-2E family transporter [Nitratireductor sp. ZSWI3]MCR4267071.1 AI-2E family transporter [Nitratireductor sp. ZSWI3]
MDSPEQSQQARAAPITDLSTALTLAARVSIIFLGLLAFIAALHHARFLLAPISLAVFIGLMLGPLATRLEARGIAPSLSAITVVLVFIVLVGVFLIAIATPLTAWTERLPQIWNELQLQLSSLRQPLETVRNLQEEIRAVTGGSNVRVSVDEGSTVQDVAVLAPTLLAQLLVFFASLYFFVATRHQTRIAILKLCFDRRLRWRVAHIFRDVENAVSEYLLSISIINVGLGVAVTVALWLLGVPSAPLWGAMAALLNFVIYIGPALMAVVLLAVGLATFDTLTASFMPPLVYLCLNALEAQFVTPTVIGRRMTLNPFIVFLAIAFWLWFWGPIGGFIAIPALLTIYAIAGNILPGIEPPASARSRRRPQRRLLIETAASPLSRRSNPPIRPNPPD